jgi:hypothetical protein
MVDASTAEFHSGTGEAQVFAVSEHAQVSAVSEEAQVSAVPWAAIVAGGVASAALTLLLLAFGAGMSLSAISPWSNSGVSSTAFNLGAGIYLVVVTVMASIIGDYLAGRLRTKWVGVHTHEVYFRDTAHGFLAWAFATVLSPAVLASAASNIVGGTSAGHSQAAWICGSSNGWATGRLCGFAVARRPRCYPKHRRRCGPAR